MNCAFLLAVLMFVFAFPSPVAFGAGHGGGDNKTPNKIPESGPPILKEDESKKLYAAINTHFKDGLTKKTVTPFGLDPTTLRPRDNVINIKTSGFVLNETAPAGDYNFVLSTPLNNLGPLYFYSNVKATEDNEGKTVWTGHGRYLTDTFQGEKTSKVVVTKDKKTKQTEITLYNVSPTGHNGEPYHRVVRLDTHGNLAEYYVYEKNGVYIYKVDKKCGNGFNAVSADDVAQELPLDNKATSYEYLTKLLPPLAKK